MLPTELKGTCALKAIQGELKEALASLPDYGIPIGVDQKLTFLNISEKSIEVLKSILCKKYLSASVGISALQNFL